MNTKYSVGEIASILGISPQTLRKYEQKGIIHPWRESNNYRLFETPDITSLFRIRLWRNMGFSLREIQELVNHNRKSCIQELYCKRIKSLNDEIVRLQMMKQSAEIHQQFYKEQSEQIGQIKIERIEEYRCLFYRENRSVMSSFINNTLLTDALNWSPPFRYIVDLPASREMIRQDGYRVGLAAPTELIRSFPRLQELAVISPCECVTIMIQHKFSRDDGKWENVYMDNEFEKSGIYRFLEENQYSIKGNIFGLTYFDDLDDKYYYQSIKYHFPI